MKQPDSERLSELFFLTTPSFQEDGQDLTASILLLRGLWSHIDNMRRLSIPLSQLTDVKNLALINHMICNLSQENCVRALILSVGAFPSITVEN